MITVETTKAWILLYLLTTLKSVSTQHEPHHTVSTSPLPYHTGSGTELPHHTAPTNVRNRRHNQKIQAHGTPHPVQIPDAVLSESKEISCVSKDSNIFEIMKKAKKYAKGNDVLCSFYYFSDHKKYKIGSFKVDKELFNKLLIKYDNWCLTAEPIESIRKELDYEETEHHYHDDVTVDNIHNHTHKEHPRHYTKPIANETHELFELDNENHHNHDALIKDQHIHEDKHNHTKETTDHESSDNIRTRYNKKHNIYEAFLPKDENKGGLHVVDVKVGLNGKDHPYAGDNVNVTNEEEQNITLDEEYAHLDEDNSSYTYTPDHNYDNDTNFVTNDEDIIDENDTNTQHIDASEASEIGNSTYIEARNTEHEALDEHQEHHADEIENDAHIFNLDNKNDTSINDTEYAENSDENYVIPDKSEHYEESPSQIDQEYISNHELNTNASNVNVTYHETDNLDTKLGKQFSQISEEPQSVHIQDENEAIEEPAVNDKENVLEVDEDKLNIMAEEVEATIENPTAHKLRSAPNPTKIVDETENNPDIIKGTDNKISPNFQINDTVYLKEDNDDDKLHEPDSVTHTTTVSDFVESQVDIASPENFPANFSSEIPSEPLHSINPEEEIAEEIPLEQSTLETVPSDYINETVHTSPNVSITEPEFDQPVEVTEDSEVVPEFLPDQSPIEDAVSVNPEVLEPISNKEEVSFENATTSNPSKPELADTTSITTDSETVPEVFETAEPEETPYTEVEPTDSEEIPQTTYKGVHPTSRNLRPNERRMTESTRKNIPKMESPENFEENKSRPMKGDANTPTLTPDDVKSLVKLINKNPNFQTPWRVEPIQKENELKPKLDPYSNQNNVDPTKVVSLLSKLSEINPNEDTDLSQLMGLISPPQSDSTFTSEYPTYPVEHSEEPYFLNNYPSSSSYPFTTYNSPPTSTKNQNDDVANLIISQILNNSPINYEPKQNQVTYKKVPMVPSEFEEPGSDEIIEYQPGKSQILPKKKGVTFSTVDEPPKSTDNKPKITSTTLYYDPGQLQPTFMQVPPHDLIPPSIYDPEIYNNIPSTKSINMYQPPKKTTMYNPYDPNEMINEDHPNYVPYDKHFYTEHYEEIPYYTIINGRVIPIYPPKEKTINKHLPQVEKPKRPTQIPEQAIPTFVPEELKKPYIEPVLVPYITQEERDSMQMIEENYNFPTPEIHQPTSKPLLKPNLGYKDRTTPLLEDKEIPSNVITTDNTILDPKYVQHVTTNKETQTKPDKIEITPTFADTIKEIFGTVTPEEVVESTEPPGQNRFRDKPPKKVPDTKTNNYIIQSDTPDVFQIIPPKTMTPNIAIYPVPISVPIVPLPSPPSPHISICKDSPFQTVLEPITSPRLEYIAPIDISRAIPCNKPSNLLPMPGSISFPTPFISPMEMVSPLPLLPRNIHSPLLNSSPSSVCICSPLLNPQLPCNIPHMVPNYIPFSEAPCIPASAGMPFTIIPPAPNFTKLPLESELMHAIPYTPSPFFELPLANIHPQELIPFQPHNIPSMPPCHTHSGSKANHIKQIPLESLPTAPTYNLSELPSYNPFKLKRPYSEVSHYNTPFEFHPSFPSSKPCYTHSKRPPKLESLSLTCESPADIIESPLCMNRPHKGNTFGPLYEEPEFIPLEDNIYHNLPLQHLEDYHPLTETEMLPLPALPYTQIMSHPSNVLPSKFLPYIPSFSTPFTSNLPNRDVTMGLSPPQLQHLYSSDSEISSPVSFHEPCILDTSKILPYEPCGPLEKGQICDQDIRSPCTEHTDWYEPENITKPCYTTYSPKEMDITEAPIIPLIPCTSPKVLKPSIQSPVNSKILPSFLTPLKLKPAVSELSSLKPLELLPFRKLPGDKTLPSKQLLPSPCSSLPFELMSKLPPNLLPSYLSPHLPVSKLTPITEIPLELVPCLGKEFPVTSSSIPVQLYNKYLSSLISLFNEYQSPAFLSRPSKLISYKPLPGDEKLIPYDKFMPYLPFTNGVNKLHNLASSPIELKPTSSLQIPCTLLPYKTIQGDETFIPYDNSMPSLPIANNIKRLNHLLGYPMDSKLSLPSSKSLKLLPYQTLPGDEKLIPHNNIERPYNLLGPSILPKITAPFTLQPYKPLPGDEKLISYEKSIPLSTLTTELERPRTLIGPSIVPYVNTPYATSPLKLLPYKTLPGDKKLLSKPLLPYPCSTNPIDIMSNIPNELSTIPYIPPLPVTYSPHRLNKIPSRLPFSSTTTNPLTTPQTLKLIPQSYLPDISKYTPSLSRPTLQPIYSTKKYNEPLTPQLEPLIPKFIENLPSQVKKDSVKSLPLTSPLTYNLLDSSFSPTYSNIDPRNLIKTNPVYPLPTSIIPPSMFNAPLVNKGISISLAPNLSPQQSLKLIDPSNSFEPLEQAEYIESEFIPQEEYEIISLEDLIPEYFEPLETTDMYEPIKLDISQPIFISEPEKFEIPLPLENIIPTTPYYPNFPYNRPALPIFGAPISTLPLAPEYLMQSPLLPISQSKLPYPSTIPNSITPSIPINYLQPLPLYSQAPPLLPLPSSGTKISPYLPSPQNLIPISPTYEEMAPQNYVPKTAIPKSKPIFPKLNPIFGPIIEDSLSAVPSNSDYYLQPEDSFLPNEDLVSYKPKFPLLKPCQSPILVSPYIPLAGSTSSIKTVPSLSLPVENYQVPILQSPLQPSEISKLLPILSKPSYVPKYAPVFNQIPLPADYSSQSEMPCEGNWEEPDMLPEDITDLTRIGPSIRPNTVSDIPYKFVPNLKYTEIPYEAAPSVSSVPSKLFKLQESLGPFIPINPLSKDFVVDHRPFDPNAIYNSPFTILPDPTYTKLPYKTTPTSQYIPLISPQSKLLTPSLSQPFSQPIATLPYQGETLEPYSPMTAALKDFVIEHRPFAPALEPATIFNTPYSLVPDLASAKLPFEAIPVTPLPLRSPTSKLLNPKYSTLPQKQREFIPESDYEEIPLSDFQPQDEIVPSSANTYSPQSKDLLVSLPKSLQYPSIPLPYLIPQAARLVDQPGLAIPISAIAPSLPLKSVKPIPSLSSGYFNPLPDITSQTIPLSPYVSSSSLLSDNLVELPLQTESAYQNPSSALTEKDTEILDVDYLKTNDFVKSLILQSETPFKEIKGNIEILDDEFTQISDLDIVSKVISLKEGDYEDVYDTLHNEPMTSVKRQAFYEKPIEINEANPVEYLENVNIDTIIANNTQSEIKDYIEVKPEIAEPEYIQAVQNETNILNNIPVTYQPIRIDNYNIPISPIIQKRIKPESLLNKFYTNNHIGASPLVTYESKEGGRYGPAPEILPYSYNPEIKITTDVVNASTEVPNEVLSEPIQYTLSKPIEPVMTEILQEYKNILSPVILPTPKDLTSAIPISFTPVSNTVDIVEQQTNEEPIPIIPYEEISTPSNNIPYSKITPVETQSLKYSGYKTYLNPLIKPIEYYEPLTSPEFSNTPGMTNYQTSPAIREVNLPQSSELNEVNSIEIPINDNKIINIDECFKTNVIDYITKNRELKNNLFNSNNEIAIPLGKIAIANKEPFNDEVIQTKNPSIGLKVWKSKVKVVEPVLIFRSKDLSVLNFMPVVNNLNEYDVKEVRNIVKTYIDEKYGDHIEVDEPYTEGNQYTIIKDFGKVSTKNHYNILWPTNYV